MKINIGKDTFTDKLTLASRFVSSKLVTSTILQGVLIEGRDDLIHVYSTNLTSYFHTTLPNKEKHIFKVIIEPKKVIEFLHFLKPSDLTLEIKEKQISISQEKTKGSFPLMVADDYPLPPAIQEKEHRIESDFFQKHLSLVTFAASTDDSRPVLTGVNFLQNDEEMLVVATDGFRLSLVKEKRKMGVPSVIIPVDVLMEVVRNIKDKKDVLFSYSAQEKIVRFRIGDDEFYSRLIDGEFPPFEKVIQTETATKVTLDREEFLRNIKLIAVFARDFSHIVVCEFKKEGLYMRPKKEASEGNSTFQEAEVKGPDQQVAFNYKFLLDFLSHIQSKSIIIEMLRPDAPIMFKIPNDSAFLHVVMPVRLQE